MFQDNASCPRLLFVASRFAVSRDDHPDLEILFKQLNRDFKRCMPDFVKGFDIAGTVDADMFDSEIGERICIIDFDMPFRQFFGKSFSEDELNHLTGAASAMLQGYCRPGSWMMVGSDIEIGMSYIDDSGFMRNTINGMGPNPGADLARMLGLGGIFENVTCLSDAKLREKAMSLVEAAELRDFDLTCIYEALGAAISVIEYAEPIVNVLTGEMFSAAVDDAEAPIAYIRTTSKMTPSDVLAAARARQRIAKASEAKRFHAKHEDVDAEVILDAVAKPMLDGSPAMPAPFVTPWVPDVPPFVESTIIAIDRCEPASAITRPFFS